MPPSLAAKSRIHGLFRHRRNDSRNVKPHVHLSTKKESLFASWRKERDPDQVIDMWFKFSAHDRQALTNTEDTGVKPAWLHHAPEVLRISRQHKTMLRLGARPYAMVHSWKERAKRRVAEHHATRRHLFGFSLGSTSHHASHRHLSQNGGYTNGFGAIPGIHGLMGKTRSSSKGESHAIRQTSNVIATLTEEDAKEVYESQQNWCNQQLDHQAGEDNVPVEEKTGAHRSASFLDRLNFIRHHS